LEPTSEQRRILESSTGATTLAQFLSVREQAAFDQYRAVSEAAVRENGGHRAFGVHIDQVLAGGEMPFQELVVDMFPSGEAALIAFDAAKETRATAVVESYILAVSPAGGPLGLVRRLRFLAPLLRPILGTDSEKERPELKGKLNPATGPVPETTEVLRRHDQTTPFYMMNLNRYYASAQYEGGQARKGTGEQEKEQESRRTPATAFVLCRTSSASVATLISWGMLSGPSSAVRTAHCMMIGVSLPWSIILRAASF